MLLSKFVIFYLIPYKKNCYITCSGKTDGLGAQTQAIYSALLYCYVQKITYCHTPLSELAHNYDNSVTFNKQAEKYFSFAKNEKIITDFDSTYKIINLDSISFKNVTFFFNYIFSSSNKFIFQKSHFHNYTNKIAPKYSLIKEQLKNKFYTNPKSNSIFNEKNIFNVAFHVRRGDVEKKDTERYTDNQIILLQIKNVQLILNQLKINSKIYIFSQGKKEDFEELAQVATLFLNGNIFDDFYSLVKADLLFMAKSSFSYSAALLSEGIIVYEPFWHPPLNEWIVLNNNLDTTKLTDAIQQAIFKKANL